MHPVKNLNEVTLIDFVTNLYPSRNETVLLYIPCYDLILPSHSLGETPYWMRNTLLK